MNRTRLTLWVAANLVTLFGIPYLLALYLQAQLAAEYADGTRTTTDGDSIGLPVGWAFVLVGLILVLLNAVLLVRWWRSRRRAV